MQPIRLAMLASGSGTTAEHVYRACQEGEVLYGLVEPVCLITSSWEAEAGRRLEQVLGRDRVTSLDCSDPDQLCEDLNFIIRTTSANWWAMYGWLPKIPAEFIEEHPYGSNQHPAPVPYFGGKGMYGRAPHQAILNFQELWHGERRPAIMTEAVCQLVAPEFDEGAIIASSPVPILEDDTAESLQRRVLPVEWAVQVEALLRIAHFGPQDILDNTVRGHFTPAPEEIGLIEAAKQAAIIAFPNG